MNKQLPEPLSVLMPVCNEAAIIEEVIAEWDTEVIQFLPAGSELIFDDGESRDGTLEKLEHLRLRHPYIRILYSKRDGFAAAARRLYTEARCPLIFFTDSDGQYVPSEFWKVAEHVDKFDIVHGAKLDRQDPLYRCFASKGFNLISHAMYGVGIKDINSAFRILRRTLVSELLPEIRCMPTLFNAEFLLRAVARGYSVKEVGVIHRPRKHGNSRGLPPSSFARECWKAYRGLVELRRELRTAQRPGAAASRAPRVIAPEIGQ
jgi:glycosyltransferase involved in cell wall biosynthesis